MRPWDKELPGAPCPRWAVTPLLEDPDTVYPGHVICVKLAMGLRTHAEPTYFLYRRHPPSCSPASNQLLLNLPAVLTRHRELQSEQWSFVFPNRPEASSIHHCNPALCSSMHRACSRRRGVEGQDSTHPFNDMTGWSSVFELAGTWAVLLRLLRRRGSSHWAIWMSPEPHLVPIPLGRWDCSRAQGRASSLTCIWAAWLVSPQAFRHQLFLTQKPRDGECSEGKLTAAARSAKDAGAAWSDSQHPSALPAARTACPGVCSFREREQKALPGPSLCQETTGNSRVVLRGTRKTSPPQGIHFLPCPLHWNAQKISPLLLPISRPSQDKHWLPRQSSLTDTPRRDQSSFQLLPPEANRQNGRFPLGVSDKVGWLFQHVAAHMHWESTPRWGGAAGGAHCFLSCGSCDGSVTPLKKERGPYFLIGGTIHMT